MAKCSIIFEDNDDGGFEMKVEFDPPLDNPLHGHTPTHAQNVGWQLAKELMAGFKAAEDEDQD